MNFVRKEYEVRFTTPAFLGDAKQEAQWRTPPIKALFRQWWRIVWWGNTASGGNTPATEDLRHSEGDLFGQASDQGNKASQVRLRLDWQGGISGKDIWDRYNLTEVNHPEVKDRKNPTRLKPVGVGLYLGYGIVGVGNRLNPGKTFIASGSSKHLEVLLPKTEESRFEKTIKFTHLFGGLGSRSRNGWGSLDFVMGGLSDKEMASLLDPNNFPARDWLRSYATDWQKALDIDWCHSLGWNGNDKKKKLLLWRTQPRQKWEEVLELLANLKIEYRTQFHFNGGGEHTNLCDRQVLSYPITNHILRSWGKEKRLANQIFFKVLPANGNFIGLLGHLPHGLPEPLYAPLSPKDKESLREREIRVWTGVHEKLDKNKHLVRLP